MYVLFPDERYFFSSNTNMSKNTIPTWIPPGQEKTVTPCWNYRLFCMVTGTRSSPATAALSVLYLYLRVKQYPEKVISR